MTPLFLALVFKVANVKSGAAVFNGQPVPDWHKFFVDGYVLSKILFDRGVQIGTEH